MSIGIKLGRAIGSLGAYAVEGAVRGAEGLGSFGADVVEGTQRGYTEKHAALLISRAEYTARAAERRAAARNAILTAQAASNGPAVTITPTPAKRARA